MEQLPPGSSLLAETDLASLRGDLASAVRRICPPWLADRADDLVQVALMRVLEVHRKSEGKAEFSSFYLRRAAYSALVDEIRRLRRRREVPLEESGVLDFRTAEAPDPEAAAAGRELGAAIRACLGRLARPRRLAVTLHLMGHSVPEAARLLGWSVKRLENLVYRGLADLRGCLRSNGVTQ